MPCRKCGCESVPGGLCKKCAKEVLRDTREEASKVKLPARTRGPSGPPISLEKMFVLCCIAFLVFLAILRVFHPEHHVLDSVVLSFVGVASVLSLCAWAIMWMELFMEEPIIAGIGFILPIMVYYLIIVYPERAKNPFIVHIVSGLIGGLLMWVFPRAAAVGCAAMAGAFGGPQAVAPVPGVGGVGG